MYLLRSDCFSSWHSTETSDQWCSSESSLPCCDLFSFNVLLSHNCCNSLNLNLIVTPKYFAGCSCISAAGWRVTVCKPDEGSASHWGQKWRLSSHDFFFLSYDCSRSSARGSFCFFFQLKVADKETSALPAAHISGAVWSGSKQCCNVRLADFEKYLSSS